MDNSPLDYIRESKLGASQIWWLSELALFEFPIHYQFGRSNKAANALSRHPHTDDEKKIESCSDCSEVEVILYSSVCEVVDEYLNTTKVLDDLKNEALSISCVVQSIFKEEDGEEIQCMLNSVSVLNQVALDMKEEQKRFYTWISLSLCYSQKKLKSSAITKIKSKAVQKYLLPFDRPTFKQEALH